MRSRERIINSLEASYREAFGAAERASDEGRMQELDLSFQRDQILLEVLLDVRELLVPPPSEEESGPSLLERAQALRKLTRLGRP